MKKIIILILILMTSSCMPSYKNTTTTQVMPLKATSVKITPNFGIGELSISCYANIYDEEYNNSDDYQRFGVQFLENMDGHLIMEDKYFEYDRYVEERRYYYPDLMPINFIYEIEDKLNLSSYRVDCRIRDGLSFHYEYFDAHEIKSGSFYCDLRGYNDRDFACEKFGDYWECESKYIDGYDYYGKIKDCFIDGWYYEGMY